MVSHDRIPSRQLTYGICALFGAYETRPTENVVTGHPFVDAILR